MHITENNYTTFSWDNTILIVYSRSGDSVGVISLAK